jgi:hypothetical protein
MASLRAVRLAIRGVEVVQACDAALFGFTNRPRPVVVKLWVGMLAYIYA